MERSGAWVILLAGSLCFPLAAQTESGLVRVPFVGCKSDGQMGPRNAPEGTLALVAASKEAASRLAYYQAEGDFGVLAPRGWSCFGVYGSGGDWLYVSPEPMNRDDLFSFHGKGLTEPVIQFGREFGDTSGTYRVAAVIARVFPAHMAFARQSEDSGLNEYRAGPYPHDKLVYRSDSVVEYETPAQADGLGTYSGLKKSDSPIRGVAILDGSTPELLLLAVRLPAGMSGLTPEITH